MLPTRGGWDDTEIIALQAYAGIMASLLLAAAKAELSGALADQLQTALDSRGTDRAGQECPDGTGTSG
jgi:hypothetical protein